MVQAVSTSTSSTELQTSAELDLNEAGRALNKAVATNPKDLKGHVQRIYFHWQRNDGPATFGALVDLFMVLGASGLPLRNRILRCCQDLLTSEQRVALLQYLDQGWPETVEPPAGTASVLRPVREQVAATGGDDGSVSLELAREYNRRKWNDLARTLLLELAAEEPDNQAVRRALAELD